MRPPVRLTGIRIAGFAPSEHKEERQAARARERDKEKECDRGEGGASDARALHDELLPRATAAHFKSVALRPSSWRGFARNSPSVEAIRWLPYTVIRAIIILIADPSRGDVRRSETRRELVSYTNVIEFFFLLSLSGQCQDTPLREFYAGGGDARRQVSSSVDAARGCRARSQKPSGKCCTYMYMSCMFISHTHARATRWQTGDTARRRAQRIAIQAAPTHSEF